MKILLPLKNHILKFFKECLLCLRYGLKGDEIPKDITLLLLVDRYNLQQYLNLRKLTFFEVSKVL